VSSGDIGLLPRDASDGAVANYFALDTSRFMYDLLQASDYRRRVREMIPLELQMALRAGCSDVRNEAQQIVGFMEQCDSTSTMPHWLAQQMRYARIHGFVQSFSTNTQTPIRRTPI
jgi:hypothetical protein